VSFRRGISWVGGVLLVFGVLVLLFVAYQLWGTSITTRLHQEALRTQFDRELALVHKHHKSTATTLPASGPTTTTTTTPISGVAPVVPGVAPAEGQPIGTIVIPSIGANFVVVQGTDTADLELGPGHYENTPLPGQPGNAGIAGHRTTYLHPFYNLNELVAGDPIYVTTTQGRFQYNVSATMIVDPTDTAVLDPTPVPTLTLTTCNPRYSASQRLVVQATLVSPPAVVPAPPPTRPHHARVAPTSGASGERVLAGQGSAAWPSIGWAAATVALVVGTWLAIRRRRWAVRLPVGLLGLLGTLVLLFFFFQSVTPLLPASF
jgi:sortase A